MSISKVQPVTLVSYCKNSGSFLVMIKHTPEKKRHLKNNNFQPDQYIKSDSLVLVASNNFLSVFEEKVAEVENKFLVIVPQEGFDKEIFRFQRSGHTSIQKINRDGYNAIKSIEIMMLPDSKFQVICDKLSLTATIKYS